MPQFNCKVLTAQGQIIKSRVEEASRLACIRKLRRNGLTPISVTPVVTILSSKKGDKTTNKKAMIEKKPQPFLKPLIEKEDKHRVFKKMYQQLLPGYL